MNISYALLRRAVQNFPIHDMTDRSAVKLMRRKWLQSVIQLGNDWLLMKPVKRIRRARRMS